MKSKFQKQLHWLTISVLFALLLCIFQYHRYFGAMEKVNEQEILLNGGDIIYSIQQESNPLDKEFQDYQRLYEDLTENQGYEYYEIYRQFLHMPGSENMFYERVTEELTNTEADVPSVQIGKSTMEKYGLAVSEGRLFSESDFQYKAGKILPVLMGSGYAGLYQVGDTFCGQYLRDVYDFEVIGFLKEGSEIANALGTTKLDTCIVLPSFSFTDEALLTEGRKIHYANKVSGEVRLRPENRGVFFEEIVPRLTQANLGEFSWTASPVELQYEEVLGFRFAQARAMLLALLLFGSLLEVFLVYRFSGYLPGKQSFFTAENLKYILATVLCAGVLCVVFDLLSRVVLAARIFKPVHVLVIAAGAAVLVWLRILFAAVRVRKRNDKAEQVEELFYQKSNGRRKAL